MQIYTQSDANAKGAIMSHLKNNSKYTKLILHSKRFSKLKYAEVKMMTRAVSSPILFTV